MKDSPMLYTIAVILIVLWLIGLMTAYTLGGWIHALLAVAVILVLMRLFGKQDGGQSPTPMP